MDTEHKRIVEEQRAFHTKHTLDRAVKSLDKLSTDPDHHEKIIGRSLKKRKIFKLLKEIIDDLKMKKIYDPAAFKTAITPWKPKAA